MGSKYEVNACVSAPHGYEWKPVYGGQSIIRALLALRTAKKLGGCAKLEWRG